MVFFFYIKCRHQKENNNKQIEIPVQINGKTRAIISADQSTAKSQSGIEKMAMEDLSVMRYIEGKKINKIIFVSGKIINLIVN